MNTWMKPAITILTVAALTQVTAAHSAEGQAAKDAMAKDKTYTGCVEAGTAAGTFTLTHAMPAMAKEGMAKGEMMKDGMAKGEMMKDGMAKGAMAAHSMAISSTAVDLSKHVGHKVSVTGSAKEMGMAKPDAMAKADAAKKMPALTVTSLEMVAASCGM